MLPTGVLRLPIVTLPLAFALAACIQTFDLPGSFQTKTPERPITTTEQARVALLERCVQESSDLIRSNKDAVTKQCGCYASTVAKAMNKDEIAYFANYGAVPMLNKSRPEEVMKRCGMTATTMPGGSRGRQPKS